MTLKAKQAKKTYKKFESEKPVKRGLYCGYMTGGSRSKPLWGDYSKVEIDRAALEQAKNYEQEFREAFSMKFYGKEK